MKEQHIEHYSNRPNSYCQSQATKPWKVANDGRQYPRGRA